MLFSEKNLHNKEKNIMWTLVWTLWVHFIMLQLVVLCFPVEKKKHTSELWILLKFVKPLAFCIPWLSGGTSFAFSTKKEKKKKKLESKKKLNTIMVFQSFFVLFLYLYFLPLSFSKYV